jgi:hypothetical protein
VCSIARKREPLGARWAGYGGWTGFGLTLVDVMTGSR